MPLAPRRGPLPAGLSGIRFRHSPRPFPEKRRDRRLNRALHIAIVTRMRMDPTTRAYVARLTAEGRTLKEIRRCLKYFGRQI